MIRILIVEPNFYDNGAIRISLDRASRWARLGAEVTVLVIFDEGNTGGVAVPPQVQLVIANRRPRNGKQALATAILRGSRHARRADVIVVGRELGAGVTAGRVLAMVTGRPLAITIQSDFEQSLQQHGTAEHRSRVLGAYRKAGLLVAVANGLVDRLTSVGLPRNRIVVVQNGVDVEAIQRKAELPSAIPLPPASFIMASGRLARQKGFDILLRAHALALERGCHHHLLIAGAGPDDEALKELAAELGVTRTVNFAGLLANPFPILQRAELFVLASRWEGLPLVLIEAQVLGVPVIASDCVSGPRELLAEGQYGALVPVEDVDVMAETIVGHFADPNLLKVKAYEAQAAAVSLRDADAAAKDHLGLLVGLARQHL